MSETILTDLQEDLQARLEADEYFVDIPVILADAGNVSAEVDKVMAGQNAKGGHTGAAVIVEQIDAEDDMANVPTGPLDLHLEFIVIENREINVNSKTGTGKSALAIARRIHRVMKLFTAGGRCHCLVVERPCIAKAPEYDPYVAYLVRFRTQEADPDTFTYVQTPVMSFGSNQVTLTCATVGAEIYYTTNGDYPTPQNSQANLYSAAFTLTEETTVRASAYYTGAIASDVVENTYTPS